MGMKLVILLIAGSINPISFKLIIKVASSTLYSCTIMDTAIVITAIVGKNDSVTRILNK